ncbi:hypothetical protein ACFL0V_05595 [Nanoarchaeota archaeon]
MSIRKRGRKAQITMFMLIGIFIVAVFLMMMWLNTRVGVGTLEAPSEKLALDLLKTGSIPYYVGLCLEKHSKEALNYVGQQGGNIYNYQNGPQSNPNKYIPLDYDRDYLPIRVSYGISAPYLRNGSLFPEPPGWPGGSGRLKQVPELNYLNFGYFGDNTLQKLCDSNGANSPFLFGPSIQQVICLANSYSDVLSTQWQMEQYVSNVVSNCTNWTAIRQETGYNVTPTGDVNITIRLGLTDIWVDAFIPVQIEVGGVEPVIAVGDFHSRLPVRLKKIVELATFMTLYDTLMLDYHMGYDYLVFSHYDPFLKIDIRTPLKAMGIWDDVVRIEDSRSVMDGENYIYQFVRENRYPALDLVSNIQDTNFSGYDIVVMENDTIVLNPNKFADKIDPTAGRRHQYDPDEDNLTYYYTGWKETCDDWFDFDLGIPMSVCSKNEPSHPRRHFVFPRSIEPLNPFDTEMLQNWTNSAAYQETHRNATFTPGHEDIGPHNVTVWVCDEGGLCDYQIIRILVIDYPLLHLNGTNMFDDIRHDAASIEDFYVLSSEGTTAYFTPLLGYVFSDKQEGFEHVVQHPLRLLGLPLPDPVHSRGIPYIWNYTYEWDKLVECGEVPCVHETNMTVTSVAVPPKGMNVSVYECLPHRNFEAEGDLMWPYNPEDKDPYFQSHLCCSPGTAWNTTVKVGNDYLVEDEILAGDPTSVYKVYESITSLKLYVNGSWKCDLELVELSGIGQGFFLATCGLTTYSIDENRIILGFISDGIYVVEQKTDLELPAWGEFFEPDKACHGGVPQVGAYKMFNMTDMDHPMLEPAPVPTVPDTWFNDVLAMTFARMCSGKRGNVCNGPPLLDFKQLAVCDELWEGEIEHCMGPNPVLIEPRELHLTNPTQACSIDEDCAIEPGICNKDKGECYVYMGSGLQYDCHEYDGETFEQVYGLNRKWPLTGAANGTCNPMPACTNDDDYYQGLSSGRYATGAATCKRGVCEEPLGVVRDCYDYIGWSDEDMTQAYCNLPTGGVEYYTLGFKCTAALGLSYCEPNVTKKVDPDSSKKACDACRNPLSATGKYIPDGLWIGRGGQSNCCGDDKGEGGFDYDGSASRVNFPLEDGGTRGAEVCDDMYGINPIDNDCDEKFNCGDDDCVGELGPDSGLCCGEIDDCKTALFETVDEGVSCGGNDECDCLEIDGEDAVHPYRSLDYGSVKTCLASGTTKDRYIKIDGLGDGMHQLRIASSTEFDGEIGECASRITLHIYVSGNLAKSISTVGVFDTVFGVQNSDVVVAFNNGNTVDCLVDVEIQ